MIEDIPFEGYVAAPGINASGLKTLLRSPLHFRHARDAPPSPPTPAQRFGTLLHAAVLEPQRFAENMVVKPRFDLRRREDKERAEAWAGEQRPGAIVVGEDEAQRITGMIAAITAHTRLRRLLERGKREVCLFWEDPLHKVECKARFDFVADKTAVIVDVKTCMDASFEAFGKAVVNYHYSLSAAHYLAGARATGVADPKRFVFVAVEKDPPFGIALYTLPPHEHARGGGWREQAMAQYARCLRDNAWPGYSREFQDIDPPSWAPKVLGPALPDEWF